MELSLYSKPHFIPYKHPTQFPTNSHTIPKSSNFPNPNKFPQFPQLKKQSLIVSARKNSRQTPSLRISTKSALQCAFYIASSLKIIPEPLNLMIKEGFEGGNGNGNGGLRFWNGFRGGGDGWGGKKRKRLQILGILGLIGVGILFLVLILGKDFEGFGELGLGVLGLGLLWILERDWKRGVKGWTLGFCSCALLVVLGLKKEDLQKWSQKSRIHSNGIMDLFRKKKPRRRFL